MWELMTTYILFCCDTVQLYRQNMYYLMLLSYHGSFHLLHGLDIDIAPHEDAYDRRG